jgi:exodeoxyribonuclease V alpha subunit
LALRNDYRHGLLNGTRGTITAIEQRARRLVVTTDERATVTIPFAYADAGSLTHGYAMTIYKAEGATVAIALVLADATMTREQLYTALSRGQQQNILFVSTDDLRTDLAHAIEATLEPTRVLSRIIDRTDAKELAIEAPQLTL